MRTQLVIFLTQLVIVILHGCLANHLMFKNALYILQTLF